MKLGSSGSGEESEKESSSDCSALGTGAASATLDMPERYGCSKGRGSHSAAVRRRARLLRVPARAALCGPAARLQAYFRL